ncbi:MAG: amino acid ABC transporter substrate-binding protein [Comamonas sp.]
MQAKQWWMRSVAVAALVCATAGAMAQTSPTLDKIKASGAITLGYREASFGFSYLDANLKPIGYSMDICYKILDAIKAKLSLSELKVSYQAVTSGNRIPLVQNGTVDLECGSTTNLIERHKMVSFSPDIFRYNVRMLVKKSSGIKSIADLQGKAVATTTGTTSFRLLRQADKASKLDITNVPAKDHTESFLLVQGDKAAAFVLDDILLAGQIANARNPKDYEIVGESLRTENQALMFRNDDPVFKQLVDETVGGLMQSGEMEKLYNQWFMAPIPPKGININYPLNAETRDAFAHPTSKGI